MFAGEEGRDHRQALVAPTPSVYRFVLRPPPGEPVLETGLGYVILPEHAGTRIRFRVRVLPAEGDGVTVFEEEFDTAAHDVWRERSIPLGAWAGEEVVLELQTRNVERGQPQVLAAWAAPQVRSPPPTDSAAGWNLILISLDTVRADRLSCYGYELPTSPHLDAFAARSIRFENAISQSSWTRPSHRSIFTGLYPVSSGGLLSPPLPLVLWEAGFATAAWTSGGQLDPAFGFARGFESYVTDYPWLSDPGRLVTRLETGLPRPFFLFVQTYEPHSPYEHTGLTRDLDPGRVKPGFNSKQRRFVLKSRLTEVEQRYVSGLYDSDLQYTDRKLGEILSALDRLGLVDSSVIVVLSDHGEQFWEHGGWSHGKPQNEHQVRVPLILHVPDGLKRELELPRRAAVIPGQVQLIDLYPTLLDLLGLPLEHQVQGRSLLPLLRGERFQQRDAFSEATNLRRWEVKALRTPRYKLLSFYPKEPGARPERQVLYDLREDPLEQHDLAAERPDLVELLQERLERYLVADSAAGFVEEDPETLDPELRKQLEDLGYVGN